MSTSVPQPTGSNGQTIVTPNERQALIQKLTSKWPLQLSKRIEEQAFEKSHGIKPHYLKFVQAYFQQIQTAVHNRASQQQQQPQPQPQPQLQPQQPQINHNIRFPNPQTNPPQLQSISIVNQVQNPLNHMPNLTPRFPVVQQVPRMNTSQPVILNQMTRLREPQKFNQSSINTLSYSQSPPPSSAATATTVDVSQDYPSQQINGTNQTDYSSLQPRYAVQSTMNVPRQRMPISSINFQQQQQQPISSNKSNDILHQIFVGNSSPMPISSSSTPTTSTTVNTNNSSTGDQLLQRILLSNTDGGSNKILIPNRQTTPAIISQSPRPVSTTNSNINNSTSTVRPSLTAQQLSPSPSLVIIPTPTQTSTVQIQPSNNITIQQSPLNNNNNNGPLSINSQIVSTNSLTPMNSNYSSPTNRALSVTGSGSISSPDDEIVNLIKYLKENINRLQLLCQKFTNEGNTDKVRQVQSVHQQILHFINNPTYEYLPHAKRLREILDQISNRLQQVNNSSTSISTTTTTTTTTNSTTTTTNSQTNVFNQCLKATKEFLVRDQKDRINILKRYLEPLSDVINGVPHKIIRLDVDNPSIIKIRTSNQSSLLSNLNDEINQLPDNIYSIEYISVSRTRKHIDNDDDDDDDEFLSKNGIILRCKLLEKSNPLIPPLRLHITTFYPEQPPEVLSLTKTMPPRLEFAVENGHPFFDQISSIFVSHLFKLNPQHTVTDILNIWRQSVQAAL
ncbi:unnamed protein product [Rotaria sordida]|uniref:ARC105/Med15 mediator subunit C-terminal domain-containing protein n=1 Tax=Rotaria sordida TaxID=392033 RepID=A0A813YMU5_9BILA|nr:unnamed protein product [Rotaria sordida]